MVTLFKRWSELLEIVWPWLAILEELVTGRERSRSPRRTQGGASGDQALASSTTAWLCSPRQSVYGQENILLVLNGGQNIAAIRRAAQSVRPLLGGVHEWAPYAVHASIADSFFSRRYFPSYVVHHFRSVPPSIGLVVVAIEVIEIFGRLPQRGSLDAFTLERQSRGIDVVSVTENAAFCFGAINAECSLFRNGDAWNIDHSFTLHHGDFLQLHLKHLDMLSAFTLIVSWETQRQIDISDTAITTEQMRTWDWMTPSIQADGFSSVLPSYDVLSWRLSIIVVSCGLKRIRWWAWTLFLPVSLATSQPLWLARDWNCLDEVLYVGQWAVVVDGPAQRQPISLFDALAETDPKLALEEPPARLNSFDLPISAEELVAFKYVWNHRLLDFELPTASSEFPYETIHFLIETPFLKTLCFDDIHALEIYVDGSFLPDSNVAAWSFSVLGFSLDGNPIWLGYLGDTISFSTDDPAWVGASRADAFQAELAALLFAGWWSLAVPEHVKITFLFDNIAAGFFAAGRWSTSLGGPLPVAVRSIHQMLAAAGRGHDLRLLDYCHVKAHKGNPLNELVDGVARAIAQSNRSPTCFADIRHYLWDLSPLIGHFPLFWKLHAEDDSFPETEDGTVVWNQLQSSDFQVPKFVTNPGAVSSCDEPTLPIRLTLVSYNVSTLDPSQGVFSARAEYLRDQLKWKGVDAAALQETRCRDQAFLEAPNYYRFLSPAAKGKGGCEIWFSKATKHNGCALWTKQDFTVTHFSPELLIVAVDTPVGHFSFISGHAPHSGLSDTIRVQWWKLVTDELRRLPLGSTFFFMGDFNAQLGEEVEGYVGSLTDDESNHNGMLLRQLLETHNIWLPATFHGLHEGPTFTWRSTKCPNGRRLDYVGFSRTAVVSKVCAWVDFCLDAGQLHEDHFATFVCADFYFAQKPRTWISKQIDREAIRDPDNARYIEEVLADAANIPWTSDVHSHYDELTSHIYQKLVEKFPQKKRRPRKSYLSDASWYLWRCKHQARRRLHRVKKAYDMYLKRFFFDVWNPPQRPIVQPAADTFSPWTYWHSAAWALKAVQDVQYNLKRSLIKDRNEHLANLVIEVDRAPPREIFAKLRSLGIGAMSRKKGRQALPMLERPDGTIATTPEEANLLWQDFAASLEFGTKTDRMSLWTSCVKRQLENQGHLSPPTLRMLPTLQFLESCCRKVRFRKATGPDGLVSELFHNFSGSCARAILPLLLKVYCYNAEPISSKGGFLVRMWKGKGSISIPEHYRGLLISNHLSKVMHSAFRRLLLPFYETHALGLQLGGQRGGVVVQAGHLVRSCLAWARHCHMPIAIVFLDIKTAFYRVVRPLVAQLHEDHIGLRELLRRFNLPPEAFQGLLTHLQEPSAVSGAGVPAFAEEHLAECHSHTWFEVPGAPGLVSTATGSRPGDPLADITFNFIFTRILRSMQSELEDAGLIFELQWSGCKTIFPAQVDSVAQAQLLEAVWADDLALVVQAQRASELLPRVRAVLKCIVDRCLSHALEPNLKAGKTEVLVALRGPGSVAERRLVYADKEPYVEFESQYWGPTKVRLVQSYTHLGGKVNAKGDDGPEIIARFAQAKQLMAKYGRSIFRTPHVDLEKKTLLLQPLVLSVMQYGLGTWANFRPKVWTTAKQRLHVMYRALLRPLLHFEQWLTLSQDEVLARLQLPSLDVMAHVARLRHLCALVTRGPTALWAILEHEQSWLVRVQESCRWLYDQLHTTLDLGPFESDWASWAAMMRTQPHRFKGLLKRAQLHAILLHAREWASRHWHCILLECMEPLGLRPQWKTRERVMPQTTHLCGPCQQTFSSHSAWAVHAFKRHGRTVYMRAFLQGTSCLACATEYWSSTRLLHHLQYMKSCAAFYLERFTPGEISPGLNSQHFHQNEPPVLAPPSETAVPCFPVQGFRLQDPEKLPHGALTEALVALLDLDPTVQEDFVPSRTVWSLVEKVREVLVTFPMPYTQLVDTWQGFFSSWHTVDFIEDPEHRAVWKHTFDVVQWRLSPAWLVPVAPGTLIDNDHREAAFEWLQSSQEPIFDEPSVPSVPCAPRERYVVHLFSGRRRADDLQAALEGIPAPEGIILHILSLDIVLGAFADLLAPQTRKRWLQVFAQGLVLALFGGPPCETWSEARFNQVEHSRVRPVRSFAEPWGLSSSSVREMRQTLVANLLMFFSLACFLIQLRLRLFGMLEHPAPSRRPDRPSIWRTQLWKLIERFECARVLVHQGLFGAPSPKPTCLAFCPSRPWLESELRQYQSTNVMPSETSIGKDEEGNCKTSRLKEYPGPLNKALAHVFARWHSEVQLCPERTEPLPPDLAQIFVQLEVAADAALGPDYAPPRSRIIHAC